MKKFSIAVLFVLAFGGACLAAEPTILLTGVYTDDNSAVILNAVEPNRGLQLIWTVSADAAPVSYTEKLSLSSGSRENSSTRPTASFTLTSNVTLTPGEVCRVELRVTDGNGLQRFLAGDVQATGTAPTEPPTTTWSGSSSSGGGCSAGAAGAVIILPLALLALGKRR